MVTGFSRGWMQYCITQTPKGSAILTLRNQMMFMKARVARIEMATTVLV